MNKDFDNWNNRKKIIEDVRENKPIFHEREIWWCSVGLNIGHEQDGAGYLFERPVLIIKKFNTDICWVLPMSSKLKHGHYYYNLQHNGESSSIILSQIRLISVKRLHRLIRKISPNQYYNIVKILVNILVKNEIPLRGFLDWPSGHL